MHSNRHALIFLLWLVSAAAIAAEDCSGPATDELERVYCRVLRSGEGASLPSLQDFRRNPPKTQRLLLKRPAERAGIVLPEPAAAQAPAVSKATRADTATNGLAACRLQADAISCGNSRFRLLGNQPNSRLDPNALTSAKQLRLPDYSGSVRDHPGLMAYLDDSYQRYLEAMISIGLAASTMSFTKFYHTFMEVHAGDADFAERMATMFEYLKKDKKVMAVSAQPTERRPVALQQCRMLNARTIVCDDVKHNWLYRSE